MSLSLFQDYTNQKVPDKEARLGTWYLASIDIAGIICIPIFIFGSFLARQFSPVDLGVILATSGLLLAALCAFSGYIGASTRLTTALITQACFGKKGARIVQALLALSLFGWFGLQTEVFGLSFLELLTQMESTWHPSKTLVILISGLLMASTAVIGIKGVGRLALIGTPLLVASIFYVVWKTGISYPANAPDQPTDAAAIGLAIAGIIGGYAVGIVIRPDMQRYARNRQVSIWSAILGIGISYPLLLFLAAYTTWQTGEGDFIKLLAHYSFGFISLLAMMLATWSTNDVNLYCASLSISPLFPKLARWKITALAGILGTLLATAGLFEKIVNLFNLIGVMTTPLLAIYGAKFIFDRKSLNTGLQEKNVQWPPFLIWILASLTGLLTTPHAAWGIEAFTLTTVPALDSLLAAAGLASIVLHQERRRRK